MPQSKHIYEFTCPYCAKTNTLKSLQASVLNIEQTIGCEHCDGDIEVIVARGLKNSLNVIISSHIHDRDLADIEPEMSEAPQVESVHFA